MTLERAKDTLQAYATNAIPPGGFLQAVLENNLGGALMAADPESKEILEQIFQYCWHELPGNIWGTPEKVKAHLYQLANQFGHEQTHE